MTKTPDDIADEVNYKFQTGDIHNCSPEELNEYVKSLLKFEGSIVSKYPERKAQIQTLNNLISVKTLNKVDNTIKTTEQTIKTLNDKNSFLTYVVIILAVISLIASCIQIYFIIWPKL
jgi:hypothetical protein